MSISRLLLTTGLLVATSCEGVLAQTSGLGATLVLRSEATIVANEAVGHFVDSLRGIEQIGLIVEGGSVRALIENAFLDVLGRHGFHVTLGGMQEKSKHLIQVTVLDQNVRYSGLTTGAYRREVQTSIEARHAFGDPSQVEYVGLFRKQDVDTVAFREDGGTIVPTAEGERSLFDRLLGPVLLIGGAFLIVYLFFTVRN